MLPLLSPKSNLLMSKSPTNYVYRKCPHGIFGTMSPAARICPTCEFERLCDNCEDCKDHTHWRMQHQWDDAEREALRDAARPQRNFSADQPLRRSSLMDLAEVASQAETNQDDSTASLSDQEQTRCNCYVGQYCDVCRPEYLRGTSQESSEINSDSDLRAPAPKAYRLQGKKIFATFPKSDTTPELAMERIKAWKPIDKALVARELHADGSFHLHCLIWLKKRIDVKSPKALDFIAGTHGNYQIMKDPPKCVMYCIKASGASEYYVTEPLTWNPTKFVERRKHKNSEMWDFANDILQSGESGLDELYTEHPGWTLANLRRVREAHGYLRSRIPVYRVGVWENRVLVVWGASGVGKSYWANTAGLTNRSVYPLGIQRSGGWWWDGYHGQRVAWVDEFDPHTTRVRTLLRILDSYKLDVQVKGGTITADWTEVIITHNLHPSQWYPPMKAVNAAAYARRMRVVFFKLEHRDMCFDCLWEAAKDGALDKDPDIMAHGHAANLIVNKIASKYIIQRAE